MSWSSQVQNAGAGRDVQHRSNFILQVKQCLTLCPDPYSSLVMEPRLDPHLLYPTSKSVPIESATL